MKYYETSVEQINFTHNVKAAFHVNEWVRNVTNGKIPQMVEKSVFVSASMLLLNAIYFNGLWKFPFDMNVTKDFFTEKVSKTPREFVQQVNDFKYIYSPDDKVRIVRLPYEGDHLSMYIILPTETGDLNEVIDKIDSKSLDKLFNLMEEMTVKVTLPKFRFDMKLTLSDAIKKVKIYDMKQWMSDKR